MYLKEQIDNFIVKMESAQENTRLSEANMDACRKAVDSTAAVQAPNAFEDDTETMNGIENECRLVRQSRKSSVWLNCVWSRKKIAYY